MDSPQYVWKVTPRIQDRQRKGKVDGKAIERTLGVNSKGGTRRRRGKITSRRDKESWKGKRATGKKAGLGNGQHGLSRDQVIRSTEAKSRNPGRGNVKHLNIWT